MDITFTNLSNIEIVEKPVPSSALLPDWYKNTESYIGGEKKVVNLATNGTIKKSMPVFDALTAGYLLVTYCDIMVTQVDGKPYFEWTLGDAVQFHGAAQLKKYPGVTDDIIAVPKMDNPWGVKTPKGYSCLFIPPVHRDTPIKILEGYVDTDTYVAPVQFPFMVEEGFEGDIPAGTPIAQVIPFKRDSFRMVIGGIKDRTFIAETNKRLRSVWINGYRNFFRKEKSYK